MDIPSFSAASTSGLISLIDFDVTMTGNTRWYVLFVAVNCAELLRCGREEVTAYFRPSTILWCIQ